MNEQEKQDTAQDNESMLAALEPIDEVKGGGWTGNVTLNGNTTIGATQGRGLFTISTDR